MTNHYTVQSVLLSRDKFKSLDSAKSWITSHGYKYVLPDVTPSYFRFRQHDPHRLALTHRLRTIPIGDAGNLIVAYPKGSR